MDIAIDRHAAKQGVVSLRIPTPMWPWQVRQRQGVWIDTGTGTNLRYAGFPVTESERERSESRDDGIQ